MSNVHVDFDVPVPMSDGTVLRADVYRPGTGDGPWPVLLQRTPYGKRTTFATLVIDILAAVERGYIVVQQDTRGRFASDGHWKPFSTEESDGRDTVAWAASLPGSNGAVGMFGLSYTGNTQWSAAIAGSPGLRAIAPAVTWSDPHDGLYQRGGALELGLNGFWTLFTGATELPRRHDGMELMAALGALVNDWDHLADRGYWELPAGQLPAISRYGGPDIGAQDALHARDRTLSTYVGEHQHKVSVPAFSIAGWYDVFLQGTLDNHAASVAAGNTSKLLIGPWSHFEVGSGGIAHSGEVNYGLASAPTLIGGTTSLTGLELRWFDHWLKGDDTGLRDEAPVRIFVMGTNTWRDEQEWPLSRAVDTPWFLAAGGALTTTAPTEEAGDEHDGFSYDPADPVLTRGGHLVMSSEFPPGAFDQAATEARPDVLVYTSEVLSEDIEVTGRIRMRLYASSDAPSTDWVVRLCDVDAKGVSHNLADGILRIHAEPGSQGCYEIDLWSTSNVFLAGHRIRVHVTSSNFPRWDRNPNTGEASHEATTVRTAQQQIFRDARRPSHIILPVIPTSS